MKLKNTKSVSPLIAVILLIVVALAIVTILLSWSQNFVQRKTASVDDAIDTSCNGADITIIDCDYNSLSDTLSLIMTNSGYVDFATNNEFSLILIDANKTLTTQTNILDSAAFNKGESQKVVIEEYEDAITPIRVEIRSSSCVGFFKTKTCN
jgi:FlaG/FlaF family flagellin (archaellin)